MPLNADRKKILNKMLDKYKKDKEMNEDVPIGFMSDNEHIGKIEHLETGIIGLDTISNGGIIKGKINIIWGGENTGKSTLLLQTIAHRQAKDPDFVAVLCDNEKVFDRSYAESLGVDPDRLIVGAGFESAENAYDFCNDFARSGEVQMVVIDTIQALASKGELYKSSGAQKSTEDNTMALIPRLLSQFLRMYVSQTSMTTTLVLLSQVRLDLGSFVPSKKKTGGQAIDHYNIFNVQLNSTKAHSGSETNDTKWPWTITTEKESPPKSFVLKMKIHKAKMEGRYDGNTLTMYFHKGKFEDKLNVLAIAKRLGLHDGKTLIYYKRNNFLDDAIAAGSDWQEEPIEFKAKGFKDMYTRIPDDAIRWLKTQIIPAYTNIISFDGAVGNEEQPKIQIEEIQEEE